MSRRGSRIARLTVGLAVVGALLTLVASASALNVKFENWVVSGALTAKKLNQTITLPPGGTFNGSAELTINTKEGTVEGPVTGEVFIPAFMAPITLLGIKTKIGVEILPVGKVEGSVTPLEKPNVELSVPLKANIAFTSVTLFGAKLNARCITIKPVELELKSVLTVAELISKGSHFEGTASFPTVVCGGIFGLQEGALLTSLFSGPGNHYEININPPPKPPEEEM
jgi:hypothetical protein